MSVNHPAPSVTRWWYSHRTLRIAAMAFAAAFVGFAAAAEPPASEAIVADFTRPPAKPWRWIREHREAWRATPAGLQVLIEPGNMWGDANDARNVLVHEVPPAWRDAVEIVAVLSHQPQKRWEQANLVWYYDDGTMVKLGLEIEHGKLNVVMGREEGDKTHTIAIVPYPHHAAELRLRVTDGAISGAVRRPGDDEWTSVGACKLPAPPKGKPPHASLQFYQGEAGGDRWAVVSAFRMAPWGVDAE